MDKNDLLTHLRQLETALHSSEVRCSAEKLSGLLDNSFEEIGYSGRRFDKRTILGALTDEEGSTAIWSQDFELSILGGGVAIISYRSARVDHEGALSRYAYRTSVWICGEAGNWRLRYHQGTPTNAFEKAST